MSCLCDTIGVLYTVLRERLLAQPINNMRILALIPRGSVFLFVPTSDVDDLSNRHRVRDG